MSTSEAAAGLRRSRFFVAVRGYAPHLVNPVAREHNAASGLRDPRQHIHERATNGHKEKGCGAEEVREAGKEGRAEEVEEEVGFGLTHWINNGRRRKIGGRLFCM